jgi:putative membrane protein
MWIALETPLDAVADDYLQSVHMFQHVLLGVIAPPLLLLGLAPSMAATLARWPLVRRLTEPVAAQVAGAAVMIAWHLPPLYNATLTNGGIHIVEHLSFIAGGVMLWWPVLDATSAQSRWQLGQPGKLAYLLLATIPQDGVALVLQFSRVLFYPYYGLPDHRVLGWDPVIDQNVAGTFLQLFGKSSFLVAALVLFYRWVARDHAEDPGYDALSFR